MVKLVEQRSGVGDLFRNGELVRQVRYEISVYQQTLGPGGLPIPGLGTIEGSIDFDGARDAADLISADLALQLEDGRCLGIRLTGNDGSITGCGHAPHGCSCC